MERDRTTLGSTGPVVGDGPLFLIADDLTGALDTAAQFATPQRPIDVRWSVPDGPITGDIALSTGTREAEATTARQQVAAHLEAAHFEAAGPASRTRAFMKVDSLLRGQHASELTAWIDYFQPEVTILAPAFPAQGRVTRAGRQFVRRGDVWEACANDLIADLAQRGLVATLCRPGDPVPAGLSIWDAETDADLAAIATTAIGYPGRLLWCGSAGLAQALAGRTAAAETALPVLPHPILGLIGTDHAVTAGQLAMMAPYRVAVADPEAETEIVRTRLAAAGVVLVTPDLPQGLSRSDAAARIETLLGDLARTLPRPATLIVAGGETLQSLCRSLGTEKLVVTGEAAPGIPLSRMVGGRYDGVTIVSKSGAFGAPDLLQRLIAASFSPDAK